MTDSLKSQAVKGVVWSAVERFSVQGIQFVLSIIIARLVAPSEYGLIAMLGIFLAIAQTFIDSGFSNALIQKKDRTEVDFSTVFYFNIVVSIFVYTLLFLASPYIAVFYKEPQLEIITKWIGLGLVISGFSIVQRAKLTISLNFKTQAQASLIAVIISGTIGVVMAYLKFGVWALVVQALINNALNTFFLWIFACWTPLLKFSWQSFDTLFSFGSKLLMGGVLHTVYLNLYSLVIGRWYSSIDVGYYNRAYSLVNFSSVNLVGVISRAMFPIFSEIQDEEERLTVVFLKCLRLCCLFIFPLMIGISVLSDPLIRLLLTDKWLPAADLLSILCLAYMWYPIMILNWQFLSVKGRADLTLKAEIIKKIISLLLLVCSVPLGIKAICFSLVLYNFCDIFIILLFVRKVSRIGFCIEALNILPIFLISIVIGMCLVILKYYVHSPLLTLLGGIIGGGSVFLFLIFVARFPERKFIFKIFNQKKHE